MKGGSVYAGGVLADGRRLFLDHGRTGIDEYEMTAGRRFQLRRSRQSGSESEDVAVGSKIALLRTTKQSRKSVAIAALPD